MSKLHIRLIGFRETWMGTERFETMPILVSTDEEAISKAKDITTKWAKTGKKVCKCIIVEDNPPMGIYRTIHTLN